ncbi:MAG TPA: tetratricopeptide repeat protein [Candidatus Dormibacteraeota bacterium]|nr:tetratricopeptide repeat protein [Candidatus Dormibacteraeota bacterium]
MKRRIGHWLGSDRSPGRPETDRDALTAAREEVERCRHPGRIDPESLRALQSALHWLGRELAEAGRGEEALTAIDESIAIQRRLTGRDPEVYLSVGAMPDPDSFLGELSTTLQNRAVCQRDLGRADAALESADEALAIRRRLAASHARYQPWLATSLSMRGELLQRLERLPEALAALEEAVAIRRRLLRSDSGQLPELARLLNLLGVVLSDAERWTEALAAHEEAVAIRRQLTGSEPDSLRDLAFWLGVMSVPLFHLDRFADAASAQAEAISIERELVRSGAVELRSQLAVDLDSLSYLLKKANRQGDCVSLLREALAIRREQAMEYPAATNLLEVADALTQLGWALLDAGRREDAAVAASEAIESLAPLADHDLVRHAEILDSALDLRQELRS